MALDLKNKIHILLVYCPSENVLSKNMLSNWLLFFLNLTLYNTEEFVSLRVTF